MAVRYLGQTMCTCPYGTWQEGESEYRRCCVHYTPVKTTLRRTSPRCSMGEDDAQTSTDKSGFSSPSAMQCSTYFTFGGSTVTVSMANKMRQGAWPKSTGPT